MRPHPSPSWAHRDFTARRLIRDASAVRERLGHPRAVPGFRCTFLPDMPSFTAAGSSTSMTTTVTGLLCWRDFHPLEWQLASLHRKSTKRVLLGWSVSPYRARRL